MTAICPFCGSRVAEDEAQSSCPSCRTAHHADCWDANGGCAVVSCDARNLVSSVPATSASPRVCTGCGADADEEQQFCRQCGEPIASGAPAQDLTSNRPTDQTPACAACGAPETGGDRFCRSCGEQLSPGSRTGAPTGSSTVRVADPDTTREPADENLGAATAEAATAEVHARKDSSGRAGIITLIIGCLLLAVIAVAVFTLTRRSENPTSTGGSIGPGQTAPPSTQPTSETESRSKPSNGQLPDQTRSEMTSSIREVIRKHHQYVADGNYVAAYAMMSERKQRRPLYDTPSCQDANCWGDEMGRLTSDLTQPVRPSVRIVRLFKGAGVAEIRVSVPMPSCPTGAWEGITWARFESGRWTYDPGWKTDESQRGKYDEPGDDQDRRLLGVRCLPRSS